MINTDITFCENQSCRIRKYCRRGVDIRDGDLLVSYTDFNCMNTEDNFFIDNQLPIIVYEFNQDLMDELVELRKFKLNNNTNQLNDAIKFGEWLHKEVNCSDNWTFNYLGNTKTTEELYKIYKDGKTN